MSDLEDYLNKLIRKKNIFREQSFENLKQVLVNLKIKKPNKLISITGTNGKGSTAEILSRVLAKNKYEVGLLTSPHLVKFNERIRINNENIDDIALLNCLEEVDKLKESKELNFYQIIAAAAFLFFSKKKLDVWILEVGLGGRLDPANYFDADISVITKIALDHENILGKGVENIGREKAGIFRTNQTVIFGEGSIPNSVLKIVEKLNVDLHKVDDTNIESAYFHKNSLGISKKIFELQFPEIDAKSELDKIDEFEFLGRNHLILENLLLDVSHNSDSIENLKNFIDKHYSAFKLNAIFTCNKEKQLSNILKPILNIIDDWYLPELNHPQIMKNIEIENYLVRKGKKVFCGYDISEINNIVNKTDKNTLFVAFGSFKLVGKFYEILNIKIENTK